MSGSRRSGRRDGILGLLLLFVSSAGAARADDPGVSPDGDPLNPAFAAYLGSGIYFIEGRTAYLFRIPINVKLRSEEKHAFGARLRFNTSIGFFDLKTGDLGDVFKEDNIAGYTFVPGIEFPIKLRRNWTLGPFVDFGASRNNLTEDTTYIFGLGLRSRSQFARPPVDLVLWNDLLYATNLHTDVEYDDFVLLRTDLDVRGMVDFKIRRVDHDLALLVKNELYLDKLLFARPEEIPVRIRIRWELGLTLGPRQKLKVLRKLIPIPRIGLSYRFGDGVNSIRFIFRARY